MSLSDGLKPSVNPRVALTKKQWPNCVSTDCSDKPIKTPEANIVTRPKILFVAEAVSLALPLSGITLYSGLYVNELISRVLEHETRFSELFFDYLHCIQSLAGATGTPEPALRRFELALLGHLGYGVDFLHCAGSGDEIEDTMTYRYREEKGFIASIVIDNSTFTGRQLRALYEREFPDRDTLRAAKRFTRIALKPYLGGKPLKSRELFRQFVPKR